MTISNVKAPKLGDTDYEETLISSFNSIDNHDHGSNSGEPVKAVHSSVCDNITTEVVGGKIVVKESGLVPDKFAGGIVRPGTLMAYVGDTAPDGWLLCHGASVSQSTYPDLFAVIGTAWGQTGDAGTFNLPDMRGLFLRGRNRSSGGDPGAGSRTALQTGGATADNVGSYQADEVKQHTHTGNLTQNIRGYNNNNEFSFSTSAFATNAPLSLNTNGTTGMTAGTYREGTANTNESRPVNVAVNWIIKI
jgi:microcystin-dependent protein